MIQIKKISKPQVAEAIAIAYEGDSDILNKYHIRKFNEYEHAVFSTMLLVEEVSKAEKLSYYKVMYQTRVIGYVIVFQGFLYSFGINIKYRKPTILCDFWKKIKSILGEKFVSILYENNSRAIDWLKKCGMKEVKQDKETHTVLLTTN